MPLGILCWIIFVLWLVLGGWVGFRGKDYWLGGSSLLLALLLGLILWRLFGPLVSGG